MGERLTHLHISLGARGPLGDPGGPLWDPGGPLWDDEEVCWIIPESPPLDQLLTKSGQRHLHRYHHPPR